MATYFKLLLNVIEWQIDYFYSDIVLHLHGFCFVQLWLSERNKNVQTNNKRSIWKSIKCSNYIESLYVCVCLCVWLSPPRFFPANNCGLRDPFQQLRTGYNIVLCNAAMDHVIVKKFFLIK